jgi:predicted translin family RNA/ssDNA-binding protein
MIIYGVLNWKLIDYIAYFQAVEDYLEDVLPHSIPQDLVKVMYINSVADTVGTICRKFSDLGEKRIVVAANILYPKFKELYEIMGDVILRIKYKQYVGFTKTTLDFYQKIQSMNFEFEMLMQDNKTE